MINADIREPVEGNALAHETSLEFAPQPRVGVDRRGIVSVFQHEGGERAGSLTHVPLDGMEAIAAVGDVRGAEVLGPGQEIPHPDRDERPERDLEWPGAAGHANVVRAGIVDVDRVPAEADGVLEMLRPRSPLILRGDLLLDDGLEGAEAPAFPYVRMLAEGIGGVEDVGPGLELGESRRSARPWRLGLKPVEEAEAHALGVLERSRLLERRSIEDAPVTIVIARPVDHADVVGVAAAGREETRIDEAAVRPEPTLGPGRLVENLVLEPPRLLTVDLTAVDVDAEREGLAVAVVLVALGLRDHVRMAGAGVLENEGIREALDAVGLWLEGLRVGLARLGLGLGADHVFRSRQRQEIAELRGVDDDDWTDTSPAAIVQVDGQHALDPVPRDFRADGLGARQYLQSPGVDVRRGHAEERLDGHARLEGQTRDPAAPRVRVLC